MEIILSLRIIDNLYLISHIHVYIHNFVHIYEISRGCCNSTVPTDEPPLLSIKASSLYALV